MDKKKVLFLTGTRADFGKMKSLMLAVEHNPDFDSYIFVTGMHTLQRYGYTAKEVTKSSFRNIHTFMNQHVGEPMEMILSNTIAGLSRYIHELCPDLIVIHGDRVEALAGAIAGALTNTKVCHIEGGERSGTIDESIRHSVSKLSHIHLVSNDEAKKRLIQMGEIESDIHIIGSPDIDLMLSNSLPTISEVREHYNIPFEEFSILMFHPVTTDLDNLQQNVKNIVDAVINSKQNMVVIYPNNDEGSEIIIREYERFNGMDNVKVYPSIQFESFLTLIKKATCMIGNSSAGIRETPFYGKPSINIGNRQNERYFAKTIINSDYSSEQVLNAINTAVNAEVSERDSYFGSGNSTEIFMSLLEAGRFWESDFQKLFNDLNVSNS